MATLRRVGSPIWAPHPDNEPQNLAFESEADETLYGGSAGGGKMLALDTPIPTPTGWATMGSLRVGDSVFSETGQAVHVLAVSDIDPSPDSYRLTFDDGSQIEACGEHRWLTFDARELSALTKRTDEYRAKRQAKRPSRVTGRKSATFTRVITERNRKFKPATKALPAGTVRTTDEIATTLHTPRGRRNHAIPVTLPLDLPERNLPLDPYLLGCWLGDGSSYKAEITTADQAICEAFLFAGFVIKQRGKYAYGVNGGLLVILRALYLLGNKHVPEEYFRGSAAQRLALIQGLMDTDGYCDSTGHCEFTTTNQHLAEGMVELLSSLGVKAVARYGRAILYGKDCGPKWRVTFTASMPVFRLERKSKRQKTYDLRRTTRFRYITACEPIVPVPMRCIAVDNPTGLYLAGRTMVPTHNSDLLLGTALTRHKKAIVFRKQKQDAKGLVDRARDILGDFARWNGQDRVYITQDGRSLEFGHCSRPGDEQSYQGRDKDFYGFDELAHFTEAEYVFITGWLRSTDPNQRCRIIGASNPPLTAEGGWLIKRWAPWLDRTHPNPAKPGELRWFAAIDGKDTEVAGPEPFEHTRKDGTVERIEPRSRTFIPARLDDNPYYARSAYRGVLQAMPEPQRSALLEGRFDASMLDDAWQVCPTAWIEAAQARWTDKAPGQMDAMGVDPAMGGLNSMVLAPRHGDWFAELVSIPGAEVKTGVEGAAHVIRHLRDGAVVQVDNIGIGAACYEHLQTMNVICTAMDARHKSTAHDRSGTLGFFNKRAEWWWGMREALDPETGDDIALPPDSELKADLAAPTWQPSPSGIKVEPKESITERLGRSPDKGDAVVMGLPQTQLKAVHAKHVNRPKTANSSYSPHRWNR